MIVGPHPAMLHAYMNHNFLWIMNVETLIKSLNDQSKRGKAKAKGKRQSVRVEIKYEQKTYIQSYIVFNLIIMKTTLLF